MKYLKDYKARLKSIQQLIRLPFMSSGGFTLIEVLVVVLIIGILGAIALPQYQRAVLKSRYSGMMPIAKALAEANEVFYLEHGEYSENPADLLVAGRDRNEGAYPDGTRVLMYDEDGLSYVRVMNDNVPNARYIVYQKHSENFADTTQCEAADERANELCVALGGQLIEEGNSSGESEWTAYLLSGRYGSGDQFVVNPGDDNGDDPGAEPEPQTPTTCGGVANPGNIEPTETNPATGTATCVNGQWKYQWSGGHVYDSDYNTSGTACTGDSAYKCAGSEFKGYWNGCYATQEEGCLGSTFSGGRTRCWTPQADNGCADSTFSGNQAHCISGQGANGCADSTFSGYQSNCQAGAANGCANSTFSGEESYCSANAVNACAGSIFSGQESKCYASIANGCAGTTIQAGAYCTAGKSGGCNGAKYGEDPTGQHPGIGVCDNSKGYCPAGTPVINNNVITAWDNTTGSYNIYAWKGGYCDATAMVSGVCPNGSPTNVSDKTTAAGWNGGYCTQAMYSSINYCPAGSPAGDNNGAIAGKCWDGNGNQVAC